MTSFQSKIVKVLILILITHVSSIWAGNAVVGPYAELSAGKGNWGHIKSGYREFITIGQRYRIRQDGDINMVRLYTADTASLTGFYIKVWRKGNNGYNLVGKSENLADRLSKGKITSIKLTTPITGVKAGDYYGYRLETAGGHYTFHVVKVPGVSTYLITDTNPADKAFQWEKQLKITGMALPVELFMKSPEIVFVGDSIIAGCPANNSFLETGSKTNIDSTIEGHFYKLTGHSYQNMGIGSQTITMIASRFENDVVGLKPEIVVMEGGVNDIVLGRISQAEFLNNWETMLKNAGKNNIFPVVLLILPWTNGKETQMNIRDDWNYKLEKLAQSYGAVVVDASKYVGQKRNGGPESNLWDIKTEYNADGVHFNSAGYKEIAKAICDSLKSRSGLSAIAEFKKGKVIDGAKTAAKMKMPPIAAIKFKGKPFFPIGTWAGISNKKVDQGWLDAGCNFIVYTSIYKGFGSEKAEDKNKIAMENLVALCDNPEYKDIAVCVVLGHELVSKEAGKDGGRTVYTKKELPACIADLNQVLNKLAEFPNIIAYSMDEPENGLYCGYKKRLQSKPAPPPFLEWMVDGLKWIYPAVKKERPHMYAMPVIAWWSSYLKTSSLYDVLMINSYPVATKGKPFHGNFADVVYDTLMAVDAVRDKKRTSVIFCPPIFNNLKWPPWGKGRAPTYEEQRYMCFAPIAVGAMGIAGWVAYRATPDYKKTVIYPVFREIKRFVPWFLGEWHDEKVTSDHDTATVDYLQKFPERVTLLIDEDMDRTHLKKSAGVPDCVYALRYRKDDNSYLFLAVNNLRTPTTIKFKIDIPEPLSVKEALANREIQLSNKTLTDNFAPLGVHAYIIRYEKEKNTE